MHCLHGLSYGAVLLAMFIIIAVTEAATQKTDRYMHLYHMNNWFATTDANTRNRVWF